ncbi:MAG: purD [Bacteroidetes bacterium]|nr:purD [Bacteroidota bacterium]
MIKALIIGSGGREHALAWKLSSSPLLEQLYCAPGNPGTAKMAINLDINIKDFAQIKNAVLDNSIGMVVVGPEDPLVNGLRDFFEDDSQLKDIVFVGPGREGAKLEGSKDFAKSFMHRWNIPTAAYRSFDSDKPEDAIDFLKTLKPPFVIKADGLAAGKGVIIADNLQLAKDELRAMMGGKFGEAGKKVVIEEFLNGIELSVFVLTDGDNYLILPEAKDYKRIGEGDTGLNTGGMGAVSPVPFAGSEFMKKVEDRVIKPTISGLKADGIKYQGFIFIGLMNCGGDPYVIEYNVRMGDPETEAVVPRIKSDLLSHFAALGRGELCSEKMVHSSGTSLTIVAVSGGYPEEYKKGYKITGTEELKDSLLFHSGTAQLSGDIVTNGGRVLALTVNAKDIASAREIAYSQIEKLNFNGIYFRRDLGLDLINFSK